jgi:hypothetical protein
MPYRGESIEFNSAILANYLPLAGGTMTGSITVGAANSLDLGTTTDYWRAVYTGKVDVTGLLQLGDTDATGVRIGSALITTTVQGTLRYDNTAGVPIPSGVSQSFEPTGWVLVNVGGALKNIPFYDN